MDGVITTELRQITHPKGDILHAFKKSDEGFTGFGEAYFSHVNKGVIKGWKKHNQMVLNLVVPVGCIDFVIYNENSKDFFEISLSRNNYRRLTVSPGLWVAFKGVDEFNMLLNVASIEHDPEEAMNIGLQDIKYEW